MSPIAVKIVIGYAAGFVAFPFVFSLVDGWPIAKPRQDSVDWCGGYAMGIFWPVVAVVWLAAIWWCAASWLGVWVREAVAGLFRRRRAK